MKCAQQLQTLVISIADTRVFTSSSRSMGMAGAYIRISGSLSKHLLVFVALLFLSALDFVNGAKKVSPADFGA